MIHTHTISLHPRLLASSHKKKDSFVGFGSDILLVVVMSIVRRVRLDLPHRLSPPWADQLEALPYAQWLRTHVAEVIQLKGAAGTALLTDVKSVRGTTAAGDEVFVTDFTFPSVAHLEEYNQLYLAAMRGRIAESYPGALSAVGSPFKYRICLSKDKVAFSALLDGALDLTVVAHAMSHASSRL